MIFPHGGQEAFQGAARFGNAVPADKDLRKGLLEGKRKIIPDRFPRAGGDAASRRFAARTIGKTPLEDA